jgi:hypothetical protein
MLRCTQLYVLEIAYAICVDVIEHIMATMDKRQPVRVL